VAGAERHATTGSSLALASARSTAPARRELQRLAHCRAAARRSQGARRRLPAATHAQQRRAGLRLRGQLAQQKGRPLVLAASQPAQHPTRSGASRAS
jgi:hypothetical protein